MPPCSRRLASATASRRAARISDVMARVADRGWAAMRVGQGDRLVEHGAGRADLQSQAEVDQLLGADPVRGQEYAGGPLPAHGGGEEVAAGRLGRHAELGKRHPQACSGVDQHEVAVGQHGEPEPDGDAVHGGEERDGDVGNAVEQSLKAPIGALDLRCRWRWRPFR